MGMAEAIGAWAIFHGTRNDAVWGMGAREPIHAQRAFLALLILVMKQ